jgi:parallel beta-helix repeat protein
MRRTVVYFVILVVFLSVFATSVVPVKAIGIIYIRADGSIDPPSAPISSVDNITYTFTSDIASDSDGVRIQRDNVIVDGAGYTVHGVGSSVGIVLVDSINVTVKKMIIEGFSWGILGSRSNNVICDNDIKDNGDGVVFYSATNWLITRNRIAESTFQDGIWLYGSSGVEVVGNDIRANPRAGVVFASGSQDNLVFDNNITENGIGILFDSGSNKVFHNNVIDNAVQAVKASSTSCPNVWDDGYPSGGNYWSDYAGTDTNGDGIGETPYIIDENNRDNYPLTSKRIIFVIPVLPLGTITALLTMFTSLGICLVKSKRRNLSV